MLQFIREIPIRVEVQETLSLRRGFLFYLAAGFSKDVDSQSGMSANLMSVDSWLQRLRADLEGTVFVLGTKNLNHAYAEVMAVARLNLIEKAEKEGVTLVSLRFREERGWSFFWSSSMSPGDMIFSFPHYLESLPRSEPFDLLKVYLQWHRTQGCEADYQHEGFKLMKTLAAQPAQGVHESLRTFVGKKLESGSFLGSIRVEHLGEGFSLELP